MIDEQESRIPIWILWVTSTNNLTTLGAITLTQWRANAYRKTIIQDSKVIEVKIEKSEANHLFNPDWESNWERIYDEQEIIRIMTSAIEKERKNKECRWTQEDIDHDVWVPVCSPDGAWTFTNSGGPEGNSMTFCPFCGKRVRQQNVHDYDVVLPET
jgi:hypothetical protein